MHMKWYTNNDVFHFYDMCVLMCASQRSPSFAFHSSSPNTAWYGVPKWKIQMEFYQQQNKKRVTLEIQQKPNHKVKKTKNYFKHSHSHST